MRTVVASLLSFEELWTLEFASRSLSREDETPPMRYAGEERGGTLAAAPPSSGCRQRPGRGAVCGHSRVSADTAGSQKRSRVDSSAGAATANVLRLVPTRRPRTSTPSSPCEHFWGQTRVSRSTRTRERHAAGYHLRPPPLRARTPSVALSGCARRSPSLSGASQGSRPEQSRRHDPDGTRARHAAGYHLRPPPLRSRSGSR